jgi:hypothetical protein
VEGDEAVDEPRLGACVGPRDGEGHLVGRMDPGSGDAGEGLELLTVTEPQHEAWRPQAEGVERGDVRHGSSRCGWLIADNSTTSRRKNSETVQSATTRTFRRNVGSA